MLEIRIMKKEVLVVHTESRSVKEAMLQEFRESYEETMSSKLPHSQQELYALTLRH